MISPEILRRYPFFAGIEHKNLIKLANLAEETRVSAGHYFFHEGDTLEYFYLAAEGAVGVMMEMTAQHVEHPVSGQFTGTLQMEDVVISALGPGDVFGWSGLVSPHVASAGAKALTPCRVVVFDALYICEKICFFHINCEFHTESNFIEIYLGHSLFKVGDYHFYSISPAFISNIEKGIYLVRCPI